MMKVAMVKMAAGERRGEGGGGGGGSLTLRVLWKNL
jgi:hypothetical protein